MREYSLNSKLCNGVDKATVCHVYQQIVVAEEISTYDGNMYISNNKYPPESSPQSQVKVMERLPCVGIVAPFTATKLKSMHRC